MPELAYGELESESNYKSPTLTTCLSMLAKVRIINRPHVYQDTLQHLQL